MSDSVECCLCGSEIVGGEADFGQWNKYSFWCPNEKCQLFDNELSMETWRALEQLQARVKELAAINLGLTKTLVEMEAENAELRKDAERYRFARDNIREDYDLPGSYFLCDEGGQFWDNTIDAAMAATDDEGEA